MIQDQKHSGVDHSPKRVNGKTNPALKEAVSTILLSSDKELKKQKVAAVVPAYNEEKRIGRTIEKLQNSPYINHIIVIDDCSTDKTYEIATGTGVTLIHHENNQGVGGAIKTGFKKALEMDVDVAVIMAGDGQMPTFELPKFLKQCQEGYGLVIGNRFDGSDPRDYGMSQVRYYGAKILSFMTYIATGQKVPDSQNGYTALTRETLEKINIDSIANRWGVHNDIISRCAIAGIPIISIPQATKYFDRDGNRIGSKHFILNIIYPNLRVFFKALTRRVLSLFGIKLI